MTNKKYILEGIIQGACVWGKCNIPSYPGRLYIYKWNCEKQRYVKDWDTLKKLIARDYD